jgi:CheY-like chemotaxis protein
MGNISSYELPGLSANRAKARVSPSNAHSAEKPIVASDVLYGLGDTSTVDHLNHRTGHHAVPQSETEILPAIASNDRADAIFTLPFSETVLAGSPAVILLAEDEAFVRNVITEVLEAAGYRVITASSAAPALNYCRRYNHPIDVLITDVVLPGMSGLELAAEFEALYSRARVLLMSGYAQQLGDCEASARNRRFLAKPFSIHTLLKKVREAVAADSPSFQIPA